MNIIKNEIDILMISETKIDNSFPISQFTMTGYSIPFRLDRTSHGGGILLFVREDIPSKIAIELFKVGGNISNNIMYGIFQIRKINSNLRSQTDFASI